MYKRTTPGNLYTKAEVEVAIADAFTSGRVYHAGGEKDLPGDAHRKNRDHAFAALYRHRRSKRLSHAR